MHVINFLCEPVSEKLICILVIVRVCIDSNISRTMLTITGGNIDDYRQGLYPEILELKWKVIFLDAQVLACFPNLQKLDCTKCVLTTLKGIEACPLLLELNCSDNNLRTLTGLGSCPMLRVLNCARNRLINLKKLEDCELLQTLDCIIKVMYIFSY